LGALFELSEHTRFGVVYQSKIEPEFSGDVKLSPPGLSVNSDDRTPDMPIDRQIRYATGVQYQWNDRLLVGGELVYADYGKAKIDNDLLKGDYKINDILFFA